MSATAGFLLVRTSSRRVGLQLTQVLEIVSLSDVRPVPVVEPAVRGLVAVRDRMVPVVHLGALLDGEPCSPAAGRTGVIVTVEGQRVCLEVEEAELLVRESVLPVPPGEILPWAVGVARVGEDLVPLLNVAAISSRLTEAVHP
jgi:chemotaxis signal transduction protein